MTTAKRGRSYNDLQALILLVSIGIGNWIPSGCATASHFTDRVAFRQKNRSQSAAFLATETRSRLTAMNNSQQQHEDGNTNNEKKDGVSKPRINFITPIASTKWLALNTINYTDQEGKDRKWDVATRTTKKGDGAPDAVVIIPLLRSSASSHIDTLLVEQYRPPLGCNTFEFPAGLIDANETVENAAMRELREETGYVGKACSIVPGLSKPSRQVCMTPGLSDETVQAVLVEVDLDHPDNLNPKQQLESGEFCTVKRLPLKDGLKDVLDKGESMPIMGLYLFALGLELGKKL